jgi:hypothetical protein
MAKFPGAPFALFVMFGATAAMAEAPADVPMQLRAGDGESLVTTVHAKGVQVYECRMAKDKPGAYEWAFVAPEAELFDAQGRKVGKHYAGPHWEATDGSRVAGSVKARADAPAAGAIPWLLLTTKSDGPDGSWSKVSSVQRINTVGGAAPTSGCSYDTTGTPARVEYTADYAFFAPR